MGKQMAREILDSGKAYRKMREMIEAQGGNPDAKPEELSVGEKKEEVKAPTSGYIKQIYNQRINEIARVAGAPKDKGAGVRIFLKEGRKVEKGDPLLEIYAEHEAKLDDALSIIRRNFPIKIEGMLLEKISHRPRVD
jgi:AMP phosphorylase